jgi:hypothetical protein
VLSVGLDLPAGGSIRRRRVGGEPDERAACPPDADRLRGLADRLLCHDVEVLAVVESMNGARLVHDQLERHGLDVLICDAERAKRLVSLACKTDKLDAGGTGCARSPRAGAGDLAARPRHQGGPRAGPLPAASDA